jgi:formaldehyde-activating enzyme involved in methanogenesis
VTIDEELTLLESHLRRLKIEYEVFFSNPTKKAPTDVEWKVLSLLRKFSDGGGRTTFSQRYRYNAIAQRYAIYSDLWRKKARIREEGYRRPQDALLSVQGVRPEQHEPEHKVYGVSQAALAVAAGATAAASVAPSPSKGDQPFTVQCSDAHAERDKVEKLYKVLTEAKRNAGEEVSGNMENFTSFVQKKTEQIRKQYGCHSVEYTVEVQDGQVRLKAKAKV